MKKKIIASLLIGLGFAYVAPCVNNPVISTSISYAAVEAGDLIVNEKSIRKLNGVISVKVSYRNAPHPMFFEFLKVNDIWQYNAGAGWRNVSGNRQANDVLYVVLQYI